MSVIVKLIKQSDTSNAHLRNLQNYILKPEANQETTMDSWYYNAIHFDSAKAEMLALNEANNHARNTFKHLLISFSPDVFPTRRQAHEASSFLLREMGLDRCVSMIGLHYDKDHVHLHVAVVTINPETFRSVHSEWSIEAMHRAAAKINHVQGWKPQDNQVYSVLDDGFTKFVVRNRHKGRALPASEVNAFHGERTAAEVAAEDVAKILEYTSIKTWDEFHKNLAQIGIEYQKKGSGAVYLINQNNERVAVKASVINRATSLPTLVKKFGEFQPTSYESSQRKIEPVNGMGDEVNVAWQKFKRTKEALIISKNDVRQLQKKGFMELLNMQVLERKKLASMGWSGKGDLYNIKKMILATEHAKQKAQFKKLSFARKNIKIQAFHERHGPTTRFDDYLKFLNTGLFDQYKDEQRKFKQANKTYFGAVEIEADLFFNAPRGIESYEFGVETLPGKLGHLILKFSNQDGRVDFIDEGKRINVLHVDKDSVRAFLQLSSQKWKSFKLTGSIEFKFMCAEEALKLGVNKKITNLEVQQMIASIIQSNSYNTHGIRPPKPDFPKWNKPIRTGVKVLKEITQIPFSEPDGRQQLAINAYLAHAYDLGNKPNNDYFRDMEIAIRLQTVGFSDQEIARAVNFASPLVISGDTHSRYTEHLISVINKQSVRDEWKDIVAKNQDAWTQFSNRSLKVVTKKLS